MPDPQESFIPRVNPTAAKYERLRQLREKLKEALIQWIPKRQRTKEQLEELASKLHEHHRNVNKTTIAGASLGTVGGVLSIAGLIAAPFTFGAGIIVSLIGAGIGGAGGLVMSGSKVAEIILTKLGLKDVQLAIDEDRDACTNLQKQLDSLESFIFKLACFIKTHRDDAVLMRELEESGFEFLHRPLPNDYTTSAGEKVEIGARFFLTLSSTATVSASAIATTGAVARSVALAGTRVAHIAGSVISAALLPLDITLLVRSSLELHRGSTSKAVEDIRKILDELECPEINEIEMLVKDFEYKKFNEAYNEMDGDKGEEDQSDV